MNDEASASSGSLSDRELESAGVGETRSKALWIPAAVGIVTSSALLLAILLADLGTWKVGSNGPEQWPTMDQIEALLACLGLAAAVGGALGRCGLRTLVIFNLTSGMLASAALGVVWLLGTWASVTVRSWPALLLELLMGATVRGMFLVIPVQLAGALAGRLAGRALRGLRAAGATDPR